MNIDVAAKKSAVDAAIESIRDYILNNQLGPGDPLPGENEFAAALGVSRNILREGLRHYRTLGIIDCRPRTGAVIVSLTPRNPFGGYYSFIAAGQDSLQELARLRNCIEHGAARFMVLDAEDGEIDDLGRLADEFEDCDDAARLFELDVEFHSRLLRLPRNRLLEGLIPFVVGFFDEQRRLRGDSIKLRNRSSIASRHRTIVAALRRRDAAALERALDEHNPRAFGIEPK